MRRLLSVVAAWMGILAVVQSMANDIALPRRTLSHYLEPLELIFVIKRIPASSSGLTTRAISAPKLIVTDSVIGVEVKAAETVRVEDFRGLRHLPNRLGDRFRAGIVLYAGEQQLSFGNRLTALPMAALWMLGSSDP